MKLFVDIAMFGWVGVVLLLFWTLPARRAVLVASISAWLFLPMAGYHIRGLPDYDKTSAATLGILLGTCLFDVTSLRALRLRLMDLPMAIWCVCAVPSSLANGLGLYDGVSSALHHTIVWGLPYLIARIHFSSSEGLRELAVAIVIGGLLYVPLCLYEIKMSPQMHYMVYGYYQHQFAQTIRFGGYRPMVFMQTGLMVGMWMAAASLLGVWLWRTRVLKLIVEVPVGLLLAVLVTTTILCKSIGAIALLLVGWLVLFACRMLRSSAVAILLAAVAPVYIAMRMADPTFGASLVSAAKSVAGKERAASLQFRMDQEQQLVKKAMLRPVLGWGGWGRNRVYDDDGTDITTTDGMWILVFGSQGLVALVSYFGVLMLAPLVTLWRHGTRLWHDPALTPVAGLSVLLLLYAIDNVANAMYNPVFIMAAGGLTGFAAMRDHRMTRPARVGLELPSGARLVPVPTPTSRLAHPSDSHPVH